MKNRMERGWLLLHLGANLVCKTQEELLRPLDSIMRVDTEDDRNPYKYHYFLESFMKNKLLEDNPVPWKQKRGVSIPYSTEQTPKGERARIHPSFPRLCGV